MRYFLLLLLTTFPLPPGEHATLTDGPGECAVSVTGSVEAYLVLHYAHEDPQSPGSFYVYTGPLRVLSNQVASVAYDWQPVAFEWYYRPAGDLGETPGEIVSPVPVEDIVEGDYQLGLVCGVIPSSEYEPPEEGEDVPPPPCPATVTGSVQAFLRGYYLHEDPAVPGQRFRYMSEAFLAEDEIVDIELAATPAAVEWWFRPYGTITAANEGFTLGATCGEIPVGPVVLRGAGSEERILIAESDLEWLSRFRDHFTKWSEKYRSK